MLSLLNAADPLARNLINLAIKKVNNLYFALGHLIFGQLIKNLVIKKFYWLFGRILNLRLEQLVQFCSTLRLK